MSMREVCEGINDDYVKSWTWPYTYHERLRSYSFCDETVDQIGYILEKLSKVPYSRRAQAITWKPWVDPKIDDPPYLQRAWFRIYGDRLVMETCWRSRDAMKAAFMIVKKAREDHLSWGIYRLLQILSYI